MRFLRKFINQYFSSHKDFVLEMKKLIGFTPVNVAIFKLAFKHSSKALKSHKSNERLEYLGDAVLDTIISDYLFRKYPLKGEGFLTEMRSKIVKRKKLGEIGERLELQRFLDYDMKYVSINSTILGNAFEALIGAIYLDAGYHATKEFVLESIIKAYIDLDNLQEQDINFKSRLFEWAQKYDRALEFRVEEEKMRGSIRFFIVGAYVDDKRLGIGEGRSKKDAQKAAAKVVYIKLNVGAEIEGP